MKNDVIYLALIDYLYQRAGYLKSSIQVLRSAKSANKYYQEINSQLINNYINEYFCIFEYIDYIKDLRKEVKE